MRVPDMTTGPTTAETEAVFGILRARLPTELALLILDRAGFWVRVSAARRERAVYAYCDDFHAPYLAVTIANRALLRGIVFRSSAQGFDGDGRRHPPARCACARSRRPGSAVVPDTDWHNMSHWHWHNKLHWLGFEVRRGGAPALGETATW